MELESLPNILTNAIFPNANVVIIMIKYRLSF